MILRTLLACLAPALLLAQAAGPSLTVDTGSARHPISRDIYGVNEYGDAGSGGQDSSVLGRYPVTARRWGGDNSVSYNWKLDANNLAANWFFETFPISTLAGQPVDESRLPDDSSFDRWVARGQQAGIHSIATVPIIGWTTATRTPKQCSYSVAKYGPQQKTDVYAPDCGNGMKPDAKTAIANDPHDVNVEVGPNFAGDWIQHVAARFGTTADGGVWLWELDNEPTWWHAVHRDIHPLAATFDEVLDRNVRWAAAIKDADPSALVAGATPPGWESYFYSAADLYAGWGTGPDYKYWNNPRDCNAHSPGGQCMGFIPWYLDQMRQYESDHGVRLIDYLDIHAYVAPDGMPSTHDPSKPEIDRLRLTSTRTFWDPNYMPPREDMAAMDRRWGTGTPRIIPRMKQWIGQYYPGTKLAITEYNWGALDDITGALAQADLLGIFGREGLDLATIWGNPKPDQPGAFVWRMFLDYDGQGSGFGETSVSAASDDPDRLSVFAAQRSDGSVTVLAINKTPDSLTSPLSLAGVNADTAQVWRYDSSDLLHIVRQDDTPATGGQISMTYPGYSLTLLIAVPRAEVRWHEKY